MHIVLNFERAEDEDLDLRRLGELKKKEEEVHQQIRMNNNKSRGKGNEGQEETRTLAAPKPSKNGAEKKKDILAQERSALVLWRKPIQTISYFLQEIPWSIHDAKIRFYLSLYDPKKRSVPLSRKAAIVFFLFLAFYFFYFLLIKDDPESRAIKDDLYWYSYWVFLGVLSSVGLGTGLHTFLLYLGPFIAKVTLAAQECGSIHFPTPPYPEQVVCPEDQSPDGVSVYDIMGKIRWESLMWGFGTALGELPPYFMARASRISGMVDADEHLEEFNQLMNRKKKADRGQVVLGFFERSKLWMQELVEKVGFWGILACASIPNPLFDLAGITCGHFLVPFTTFFGATVIGKALIKVHIQMTFVILAFNEELLDNVVKLIRSIPKLGELISDPFVEMMNRQKQTLHGQHNEDQEGWILAFILEKIVLSMIIYFLISIVNSMAQSYHRRMTKDKVKAKS